MLPTQPPFPTEKVQIYNNYRDGIIGTLLQMDFSPHGKRKGGRQTNTRRRYLKAIDKEIGKIYQDRNAW